MVAGSLCLQSHSNNNQWSVCVVLCDKIMGVASSVLRRRPVQVAIMTGPRMLHPWRDRCTNVHLCRPSEERLVLGLLLFPRAARTEGTAPRPPETGSHGGRPPPARQGSRPERRRSLAAVSCSRRLEGATGPRPEEDGALLRALRPLLQGWRVGDKARRGRRRKNPEGWKGGIRWERRGASAKGMDAWSRPPEWTARQGVGRDGLGPPLARSL